MKNNLQIDDNFKISFSENTLLLSTTLSADDNLVVQIRVNNEDEVKSLLNSLSIKYVLSNKNQYEFVLSFLTNPVFKQLKNICFIQSVSPSIYYVECRESIEEQEFISETVDEYERWMESESWKIFQSLLREANHEKILFKIDCIGTFNIKRFTEMLSNISTKPQNFHPNLINDFKDYKVEIVDTFDEMNMYSELYSINRFEFTIDALCNNGISLNIESKKKIFLVRNMDYQQLLEFLKNISPDKFESLKSRFNIVRLTMNKIKIFSKKVCIGRFFYENGYCEIELLKKPAFNLLGEEEFNFRFAYSFEYRNINEVFKNLISGEIDLDEARFYTTSRLSPGYKEIIYPRKAVPYFQTNNINEKAIAVD